MGSIKIQLINTSKFLLKFKKNFVVIFIFPNLFAKKLLADNKKIK